ncbi:MAG: hypothetical protein SGI98_12105 [Verrucomicrobiota bacterium]|nr:hypothetical protein [Verrucomicrobiota bacterium]
MMNRSQLRILMIAGFMFFAVRETALCQEMERIHTDMMKEFSQEVNMTENEEGQAKQADKADVKDEQSKPVSNEKDSVQTDSSTPKSDSGMGEMGPSKLDSKN